MFTIGAVKTNSMTKVTLLGYSGSISWITVGYTTTIDLPYLPLDSLQWAWSFKFEGVSAN